MDDERRTLGRSIGSDPAKRPAAIAAALRIDGNLMGITKLAAYLGDKDAKIVTGKRAASRKKITAWTAGLQVGGKIALTRAGIALAQFHIKQSLTAEDPRERIKPHNWIWAMQKTIWNWVSCPCDKHYRDVDGSASGLFGPEMSYERSAQEAIGYTRDALLTAKLADSVNIIIGAVNNSVFSVIHEQQIERDMSGKKPKGNPATIVINQVAEELLQWTRKELDKAIK